MFGDDFAETCAKNFINVDGRQIDCIQPKQTQGARTTIGVRRNFFYKDTSILTSIVLVLPISMLYRCGLLTVLLIDGVTE